MVTEVATYVRAQHNMFANKCAWEQDEYLHYTLNQNSPDRVPSESRQDEMPQKFFPKKLSFIFH